MPIPMGKVKYLTEKLKEYWKIQYIHHEKTSQRNWMKLYRPIEQRLNLLLVSHYLEMVYGKPCHLLV